MTPAPPFDLPPDGAWFFWNRCAFLVNGPDRVRFLNGQVSNDVSRARYNRTIAACLCGLKGKVEALVWISEFDDESLLLDGDWQQQETIRARLEKYLIADDCEIEDVTDRYRLVHHLDSDPGDRHAPPSDAEGESRQGSWRLGLRGTDLWLAEGEPLAAIDVDEDLELGNDEFERLTLFSLLPEAGIEITGEEFPSELGLDRWAVDFHKGCYLGQEVVSRIHSVGRDRKSLVLLRTDFPTEAGMELRDREGRMATVLRPSGKKIGGSHYSSGYLSTRPKGTQSTGKQPLSGEFDTLRPQLERPV